MVCPDPNQRRQSDGSHDRGPPDRHQTTHRRRPAVRGAGRRQRTCACRVSPVTGPRCSTRSTSRRTPTRAQAVGTLLRSLRQPASGAERRDLAGGAGKRSARSWAAVTRIRSRRSSSRAWRQEALRLLGSQPDPEHRLEQLAERFQRASANRSQPAAHTRNGEQQQKAQSSLAAEIAGAVGNQDGPHRLRRVATRSPGPRRVANGWGQYHPRVARG